MSYWIPPLVTRACKPLYLIGKKANRKPQNIKKLAQPVKFSEKENTSNSVSVFLAHNQTEHFLSSWTHCIKSKTCLAFFLKGEVRRKMNFTYVLGFVVLRDVVKVFSVSSSSFARKTTGGGGGGGGIEHEGTRGVHGPKTKWDLKLSFPSSTYFIRYLFI